MIVAVTGAQGFLGARACAGLAAAGHEVRRLTRAPRAPGDRRFALGEEPEPGLLGGADALIHAAHDFGVLGRAAQERVNVAGSQRLLGAAAAAGVKRVVFVSSISAFPGCASEYGRAKLAVEEEALAAGGIVVRPGLAFGGEGGMFGALARLARLPLLPVFDGGRQPLWLAHADDVARDLVAALGWSREAAGGPVTLAHPQPLAFAELLRALGARRLVSVPSALALAPLRALEAAGLALRFRSDSLISLLNPNPAPDWSAHARLGLSYRRLLQ